MKITSINHKYCLLHNDTIDVENIKNLTFFRSIAEARVDGIISFDYFSKENGKKKHVHQFVNRYSALNGYYHPAALMLKKIHIKEGICYHQLICDALTAGASVHHVHEPIGLVKECEVPFSDSLFADMQTHYCRQWHGTGMLYHHEDSFTGSIMCRREPVGKVLISILSSNYAMLASALESLIFNTYKNHTKIVIGWYGDKDSYEELLKKMANINVNGQLLDIVFFQNSNRFNFSTFNNIIFDKYASGFDYFMLLNDDVEIIRCNFLYEMMYIVENEGASIVGNALFYPSAEYGQRLYQHGGVILGDANEMFKHVGKHKSPKSFYLPTREVSAVTFASSLISTNVYGKYRLNEDYYGDCNDIDFCFRVKKDGGHIWYCANAEMIHRESHTRKNDPSMSGDRGTVKFVEFFKHDLKRVFNLL